MRRHDQSKISTAENNHWPRRHDPAQVEHFLHLASCVNTFRPCAENIQCASRNLIAARRQDQLIECNICSSNVFTSEQRLALCGNFKRCRCRQTTHTIWEICQQRCDSLRAIFAVCKTTMQTLWQNTPQKRPIVHQ